MPTSFFVMAVQPSSKIRLNFAPAAFAQDAAKEISAKLSQILKIQVIISLPADSVEHMTKSSEDRIVSNECHANRHGHCPGIHHHLVRCTCDCHEKSKENPA